MAVQVQFRRGNTSQHSTFTGAEGEITVNTDKDILVVHDGTTVGGHEMVSNAQLSANLGNYQTTAGLSANVATLTANNTSFVGSVSAANVVSNAQLSSNLGNYQTTAGLATNVATLTANNTSFVGSIDASNVVSNSQLSANLSNYQTTAGLATNVATLTANNTSFVGSVSAANVVSNAQLSGNLSTYAALTGANFTGAVNVTNNFTVTGNLIVTGTTFSANVTNLDVKDLNITVAKGAATAAATDGAGLAVDIANIGWYYNYSSNTWQSNVGITPSANLSFNLGSSVLYWSNVYANNIVSENIYGTLQTSNQPNITANNTSFIGSVSAANVVSNAQLSANLGNYQTTAGLSANVATLNANNTNFVGSVSAANVVSNAQLSANLGNYQTTTGLSANVATLTANNTNFVGSVSAANVVSNGQLSANLGNYQTTAGMSTNVATLTANNTNFVGSVSAANVVSNAQLSANLGNYQTTAGLSANVATLTANNTTNFNSQPASFYTNATNITTGTLPYAQIPANIVNTTADFTRTGITTFSANIIIDTTAKISANGSYGSANQVLTNNGNGVFWSTTSGGGFTNGQSISVNNFVVTGSITANGGLGTSGQVLTSNGSAVYWSTSAGGGGGGGITTLSFTGFYSGYNNPTTGTLRRYFANNITVTKMTAWVGVTSGSNLKLTLKKNGSEIANTIIAANASIANVTFSSNVISDVDYLTLDLTSGSGTDIGVRIDYTPYA